MGPYSHYRLNPFVRFRLDTRLTPDEVETVLRSRVIFSRKWFQTPYDYLWYGWARNQRFKFSMHRNQILPAFCGRIHPALKGSQIFVRVRPRLGDLAFLAAWYGMIAWLVVAGLPHELAAGRSIAFPIFAIGLFALAGVAWLPWNYWPDVNRARAWLIEVLEAAEVPFDAEFSGPPLAKKRRRR